MTQADTEGREKAQQFRAQNNLGSQPIGDLITLIEQTVGADVAVIKAPNDEHGMTMRAIGELPSVFIAVACTSHPMRQRSTLAHELGHVLFEDWGETTTSWVETRATSFARHLLVPLDGVGEAVAPPFRNEPPETIVSRVVQRFLVAPAIAAIVLEQKGYIRASEKDQLMKLSTPTIAARNGWSDQYQALQLESAHPRPPRQLLSRAVTGYVQNVVSLQQLAALRGKPLDEIEAEYQAAGIVPHDVAPRWADPSELPDVDVDLAALEADLAAGEE